MVAYYKINVLYSFERGSELEYKAKKDFMEVDNANDPEGLIIERAKWSHFNVTTLAILPESFNSLRVRLSKRIGFKSHIKPEFCQDLS